jgi:hypothetical protein
MSLYQELLQNPPVIKVKDNSKEVVFTTISCMCDNIHYLNFKKNEAGEFKVSSGKFALSNWQMPGDYKTDLCWAADNDDWTEVIRIINSGTELVQSAKYR